MLFTDVEKYLYSDTPDEIEFSERYDPHEEIIAYDELQQLDGPQNDLPQKELSRTMGYCSATTLSDLFPKEISKEISAEACTPEISTAFTFTKSEIE